MGRKSSQKFNFCILLVFVLDAPSTCIHVTPKKSLGSKRYSKLYLEWVLGDRFICAVLRAHEGREGGTWGGPGVPVVLRGGFTKAREHGTTVTQAARPLHDRYFRYTTVTKVSVGSASLVRGRRVCAHARACWL